VTKRCFLLPKPPPIVVRRTAAIGDVIASTVVADRLAEAGFAVTFQCHPAIQPLLKRQRSIVAVAEPKGHCDINLDGCYENHPERTKLHFSDLFLSAANHGLRNRKISLGGNANALATLRVSEDERGAYLERLAKYPKPWVWICPRSNNWANRTIQDHVWTDFAKLVPGTKFWLYPGKPPEGIVGLEIANIGTLPVYLACGDLLVSVDTGPLHVAAAVGCPAVAIEQASAPELHLSDQRDFVVVRRSDLDCLNCQKNICPKAEHLPPCQAYPPEMIAEAVNKRLRAYTSEDVSAVVTTFKPEAWRINKCIEHVLPQVSEVIVTCEAAAILPPGLTTGPKIRYVRHRLAGLGYGKNANFGFRHSNGKYVLLLNDDVFLRENAVAKLMEEMKPDVGVIGHLMYYENGTIQHGGKYRNPGMRGWGHVDHRRFIPTVKEAHETENVTGASILVRREAFYKAKGYDERFHLYAEDDAFCLQVRQAGYKIVYTPHAIATHLEGQTNKLLKQGINDKIMEGNKTFAKVWGWWIEANIDRVPGVF
jgi:GT2 family glycosyltransferase/ADP-heptose:LPS heptosyltransferase